MGQAIAKMSRFIIHIICRICGKDGNSKKRTRCNLDDNSSCSTDVATEANEPLITATHDDLHVISIQTTLDDYLSCSSNVVVESNEQPLITTTHDSHVISIQTLDDNSSCSADVVAELKGLLIATIDHDSHAISIQVEDKEHDPPSADNCSCSKLNGNDNKNNAKVKEIATVTIPKRSKVKRKDKWLIASPAVEKKNVVGGRKKVGILPTPSVLNVDPTFFRLPRSNSNCRSVSNKDKVGIPPTLSSRPIPDKCNRSKSSGNENKNNAKVKEIATVTIPKPPKVKREGKWLRASSAVEKKNIGGEGKKIGILPTPPAINVNSTFLHLPRSNPNCWNVANGEKVGIPPILSFPPTTRDGIRHYCSNHRILLVGEGDFSFSACLAKAFGSADNMVATSLDSLGFLENNYPSAKPNIGCLRNRGGTVLHKVDATNMEFNILVNEYIYDRIIFNFPLAGFFNESRRQDLKRNRNLVRSFMKNAKNLMASDGEIHITHKTSPLYQEWGMENLAKQCGFKLIEEVEFKLNDYPGYHNKYGFGGNDDFNCYPSNTYKFGLK